jgi:hypothetical protein
MQTLDQFVPERQMTGRYFSEMPDLHFHTVLPPLNVGENVSVPLLILLFARCGAAEE